MSFVVDTSVMARLRIPAVRERVEALDGAGLARTAMTDLEIGFSASNGEDWDRLIAALDAPEPLDVEARHFARAGQVQRLLAVHGLKGRKVPDLLIAAVAETTGGRAHRSAFVLRRRRRGSTQERSGSDRPPLAITRSAWQVATRPDLGVLLDLAYAREPDDEPVKGANRLALSTATWGDRHCELGEMRPNCGVYEKAVRAALERHWEYGGTDQDIAHEIYHDDAVLEFPQSGERFEGVDNFREWRRQYPAKLAFQIRRIRGQGNLWVAENSISYDDGPWNPTVNILEFRGDKVARESVYIAQPWDPPDWRAPWRAAP